VAGGVAANQAIRAALRRVEAAGCVSGTAAAALHRQCRDDRLGGDRAVPQLGHQDGMDLAARPRWPLDLTAPAMIGSGKKGAKA
jgi:N6-L-threonylcarbamoyladenine synthase